MPGEAAKAKTADFLFFHKQAQKIHKFKENLHSPIKSTPADMLEGTDSAIGGFDDGIVYQTVSSIRVLGRERLSIRFKDGTELEQELISRRVSA